MHAAYRLLVDKNQASHEQGRRSDLLDDADVAAARLYSYAYRTHTIGAFHATRRALEQRQASGAPAAAQIQRACEQLIDLANLGMEPVPEDFRVAIATFHRYDTHVRRTLDALKQAQQADGSADLSQIAERFRHIVGQISSSNGLCLTRDLEPQKQASFVVPNLGITIVPLVYGDHHSWNLAYLNQEQLDVPFHKHHSGVEIHLGYAPLEGHMILGDCKSPVTEGYALPIAPGTRHGWTNLSGRVHHVPFIFGSLKQGGWGVFLDVEPQPIELEKLRQVERTDWRTGPSVYLERQIDAMAKQTTSRRQVLIAASTTDRNGSGGLELAATRVGTAGFSYPTDSFRIISVVRGNGRLEVGPADAALSAHDHAGVPRGMIARAVQAGDEPLVLLDTLIRGRGAG
jgi:hypothetical protein